MDLVLATPSNINYKTRASRVKHMVIPFHNREGLI